MSATTNNVENWHELLTAVEGNQGVHRVTMATLRQLEGRQRVGKHILNAIEEKLSTLGLGHLPEELPNRQQQQVLLYRFGTPASELINAVREGLTEPVNDTTYEYLHRFNSIPDPETVVSKEEFGDAIEKTARSVLELLSQVRPEPDEAEKPRKRSKQPREDSNVTDVMEFVDRLAAGAKTTPLKPKVPDQTPSVPETSVG